MAPGARVAYHVTLDVDAYFYGTVVIGAVAKSDGYDPDPANNAAISAIRLMYLGGFPAPMR